jgi:hypothetical protein
LRMQRVSLGQLHDLITDEPPEGCGEVTLVHRETTTHTGDMFTKPLPPVDFVPAIARVGMRTARLPLPSKKGKLGGASPCFCCCSCACCCWTAEGDRPLAGPKLDAV